MYFLTMAAPLRSSLEEILLNYCSCNIR